MKRLDRKTRLERVVRLRQMDCPAWIIRSDQVALACVRKGLKPPSVGKPMSQYASSLMKKYVEPLMEK